MTDAPTLTANARWWFDGLAVIKATSATTNGQLAIVEVTEPPGAEAPLHVHHREDEAFYVLDGSVTLHVGDETVEATAGDFAFGPRDVPAPLHGRPRRLPDALHLHARRIREARHGHEPAGRGADAAAGHDRGAGLGARGPGRRGQPLRAVLLALGAGRLDCGVRPAPVAQLDRASVYGTEGQRFESSRARLGMRIAVLTPLLAVAALALLPAGAAAQNPWLERRVLNIAHQGGESEFPSNTMYAFKRSVRAGADMLELDIGVTRDGEVVVMHDTTVNRTTNGRGTVASHTLKKLRKLDGAYWFAPGRSRSLPPRAQGSRVSPARRGDRQAQGPAWLQALGLPRADAPRGHARVPAHADQRRDQGTHEAGGDRRVRAQRGGAREAAADT